MNEPIVTWDYLTPIQITIGVRVDERMFRDETGLLGAGALDEVVVTLQADCPSAGWRQVQSVPLNATLDRAGFVDMVIAPGQVADLIDISVWILLNAASAPARADRVAHLRGSRLYTHPETWRANLEGTGGGFPTDAVDFESIGLPQNAPWHLKVLAPDPTLPFMKAVRLMVNTGHPVSKSVLDGADPVVSSVLFHDLLLQMLLSLSTLDAHDLVDLVEDSYGYVLDGLCETYLSMPLTSALRSLREDQADLMSSLKASTGLLQEVKV